MHAHAMRIRMHMQVMWGLIFWRGYYNNKTMAAADGVTWGLHDAQVCVHVYVCACVCIRRRHVGLA